MAHTKTIQFYRNGIVVKPDTQNNKTAIEVAKENFAQYGAKNDGEITLIRYQEGDNAPIKTIAGIYSGNGDSGHWTYLNELDDDIVIDSNYVHTDNNYTSEDKQKLSNMDGKQVTVITVTNPNGGAGTRTFKDKDGNILSDSALLAILKDETKEVVMEYKNEGSSILKYLSLSYYEYDGEGYYFTFTLVDAGDEGKDGLHSDALYLEFYNNALGSCVLYSNSYPKTVKDSNAHFGQGYSTSSSLSGTTCRIRSITSYSENEGGIVAIYFSYDVPQGAYLNITGLVSRPIYYRNAAIGADVIKAGDTVTFMFHSNRYYLISNDRWGLNA